MYPELFASRMERVKPSSIREFLAAASQPDVISFGGGFPDPALFPTETLTQVFSQIMKNDGGQALQYTASDGLPSLRKKLAARMKKTAGVSCEANEIFITQGGQQGMDLMAKLLINKDDVIVTERPTFLGGLLAFNAYEPQYKTCGMDNNGMKVDELEDILKNTPKVKFIYTIPDFHNPMGVTMSLERRKKLLELANKYGVMILEDTPYREVRYEGEALPAIKSFDTQNRVVFLGSFSKILSPGMRLGWVAADAAIVEKMVLLKTAADTQCSTLNMFLADRFMEMTDIDEHIGKLRDSYKRKKDFMLQMMQEHFPAGASWTNPEGGLFTWLTLPEYIDSGKIMQERILPEARVIYVPSEGFYPQNPERNHARMNYSCMSEEKIRLGISRMGAILKDYCK
ncbi:MAG: PLP-dependent aminotransferase family protein [Deltaproteobacteria bacterium]|jgi:2-aminoadipate transaminase|nr:PLP-dependent aminotransferase family protein [Deltaproteobacteria bacterium]